MTEQVQLELVRQAPLMLTALFSLAATVLSFIGNRTMKVVQKELNSKMHEDRAIAQKVSDEKAIAAHAAGAKEERDKHG